MHINSRIVILLSIIMNSFVFFVYTLYFTVVKPKTNDELTTALCSRIRHKLCVDDDPKLIMVEGIFDFIGTEGTTTKLGCWHKSSPLCYLQGQQQLNVANQCAGLEPVNVTYDNAGRHPLFVGSNKNVVGVGLHAGLKGKGLYLHSVYNIVIKNISITDINARVIWAGDGITMDNVRNVLIDGNYIQRIGRQMVVTGYGACQNVTISNNIFNGSTPFSSHCDGRAYWILLFLGKNDTISVYNNTMCHVSGRFPHMTGMMNSSVLVHFIENTIYDTSPNGGIEVVDPSGRLLAEGNTFTNVSQIFIRNNGSVFLPLTQDQCDACIPYLGRPCEVNILVNSTLNSDLTNDSRVLSDLKPYASVLTLPRNTGNPNNTPNNSGNTTNNPGSAPNNGGNTTNKTSGSKNTDPTTGF